MFCLWSPQPLCRQGLVGERTCLVLHFFYSCIIGDSSLKFHIRKCPHTSMHQWFEWSVDWTSAHTVLKGKLPQQSGPRESHRPSNEKESLQLQSGRSPAWHECFLWTSSPVTANTVGPRSQFCVTCLPRKSQQLKALAECVCPFSEGSGLYAAQGPRAHWASSLLVHILTLRC